MTFRTPVSRMMQGSGVFLNIYIKSSGYGQEKMTVDIVLLTLKPDKSLFAMLKKLEGQTVHPQKIIIMNTEEKYLTNLLYGTKVLEECDNIEIYNTSRKEFDHGRTRNEAARHSASDFLIFMTQDAMPADEHMTEELLRPMKDPEVAVSYGRQLAREKCSPVEKYNRMFNYPDRDRVKSLSDIKELGIKTFFCSNVCACYRRSIFDMTGGFIKYTIFNEDMLYAAAAVKAGYKIYYASAAKVYHSHDYSAAEQYHRNFDLGVSQADHPEVFSGISSENEGRKLVSGCVKYLADQKKSYLIPDFLIKCAARYIGYHKGLNYRKMSPRAILRATMNPYYFERYWDRTRIPADVHAGYGKNKEGL